jgi:hypothetical protein
MAKIQEFISPAIAKNLEKELLKIVEQTVKNEKLDTADTALYQRQTLKFRDIIDSHFPSMLIVDYNSIKSELKQYQDIDTALKTYISETEKATAKDYNATKFSDSEINLLVEAIKIGMRSFTASSATPISYKKIQQNLNDIFKQDLASNTAVMKVKSLFSKVYKLTDFSNSDVEIYILPNFANAGKLIRRHLDTGLTIAENDAQKTIKGLDSIGKILDYGHTAAGYINEEGNTVLNFNSPKLMAVMFDVLNSGSDKLQTQTETALKAATSFVEDTRQTEVYLTIDKEFSEGFVKVFVAVGGNVVKFENSLINSRRGSVLETKEKRGVNKAVLEKLASAFTKTGTDLSKRLSRYILTEKKSPNIIEYAQHLVVSALKGEKPQKYKSSGNNKAAKTSRDSVKKEVISGIVKTKVKLPKLPKLPKPNTVVPKARPTNLANLLVFINQHLQDVISANMGDGSRRDVLNYRTGRFAGSAKVESLSQSREGMITAFYSYMKNPYATFSQGGRQQNPKTRDPKLLISTSIREIAAQQVANKMRAVVV